MLPEAGCGNRAWAQVQAQEHRFLCRRCWLSGRSRVCDCTGRRAVFNRVADQLHREIKEERREFARRSASLRRPKEGARIADFHYGDDVGRFRGCTPTQDADSPGSATHNMHRGVGHDQTDQ